METLADLNGITSLIAQIITILGVPGAIYVFINEKRKERKQKEYEAYNALDNKYFEYLQICLNNSDLDVYSLSIEQTNPTGEKKFRELIIFEMLISILERAFIMYEDQSDLIKQEQWKGWHAYSKDWMGRENFRDAWNKLGTQWDSKFENYMNDLYNREMKN